DVEAGLGAGRPVPSISAGKLGPSRLAAVEIDPDARGNAEENIRANSVSGYVEVIEGDAAVILPLLSPVRVVIANIILSVIIPLLPVMKSSLTRDGQAIVAGILAEEREAMLSALSAGGWAVGREETEDVWWSAQVAP